MAKVQNDTMDKLVALCKGRGFVFPGSEIYGGLANSWDYGPLGVEFKNNVKRAWWKKFVQENKYNVGIDCAILMNRQVWVASGHVGNFNDPLMDCKACKARFRADKLIEDWAKANGVSDGTNPNADITREQLVTMLYRYAGSPKANGSLNSFSDAASVNSYAVNAMQWAIANGIVNGSNGKLNPQNNATRAQVAAILMRFCEMSK